VCLADSGTSVAVEGPATTPAGYGDIVQYAKLLDSLDHKRACSSEHALVQTLLSPLIAPLINSDAVSTYTGFVCAFPDRHHLLI
jgi:hypothetical protein